MLDRRILQRLYVEEGKSMEEIANQLKCSLNKVRYWMARHGIKVRSRSDAMYQKYNPGGDPFTIKVPTTEAEWLLLGLGLGLWWGEGTKRSRDSIRLGNTDPKLISKFLEFLDKMCGIPKDKIHFGLQVFSDMNPEEARQFWIRSLDVSPKQFHPKIVVTGARSIGTYRNKTRHGVLTVYCSNVKLRKEFDELMFNYAEIAQSAERIHGGSH